MISDEVTTLVNILVYVLHSENENLVQKYHASQV